MTFGQGLADNSFEMLFRKKRELSIRQKGFLQATGVVAYCLLVGLLFWNANILFGQMNVFMGPVTMMTLFSVSVLVCGLLVFYLPYRMFFDKKQKEAIDLVLYTTGWLAVFLVAFLLLSYLFR